jgi:hypothetical protein
MRSLVAAVLQLLFPARGGHRSLSVPVPSGLAGLACPSPSPSPPPRPARPPVEVVLVDGLPLVRPYVVLAEWGVVV